MEMTRTMKPRDAPLLQARKAFWENVSYFLVLRFSKFNTQLTGDHV